MDTHDLAIATITWARSPDEESLLRRSLLRLAEAGRPVAIADTGTSPAFLAFLQSIPQFAVTVPAERGLVPQIHASLTAAAAAGTRFILYTEPDKDLFFGAPLREFLARAPGTPDVGVVLAARSEASFATYPPMQRYAEGVINRLCGELLGPAGDYSYGPFLMNRALLSRVMAIDGQAGWGWRHSTFRAAHRQDLRIVHLSGEYACPPDQGVEDEAERIHRLRQLSQNVLGLIA